MLAPNFVPIFAATPEAPIVFARDREASADGFALLLALLAGARGVAGVVPATPSSLPVGADAHGASRTVGPAATPGTMVSTGVGEAVAAPGVSAKRDLHPHDLERAVSGGAPANTFAPTAGTDAGASNRAVGPVIVPGGVSAVAGEAVPGPGGFAKLELDHPDLYRVASGAPTGPVAAGDPSHAGSAFEIAGSVPPGPERLPGGSSVDLPSASPVSSSPSSVPICPSPLEIASLPVLEPTVSGGRIARSEADPIRNLASFHVPVTETEGNEPAVELPASAVGNAAAAPSHFPGFGRLSVGEPAGTSVRPTEPFAAAASLLVPPAGEVSSSPSAESGPEVCPTALDPSEPLALPSAGGGASLGASLSHPADRSSPGRPDQRPSQPPIEGTIVAEGPERAVGSEVVAAAGGGAATASDLRLGSAAGPAEAPGERVAALGTGRSVAPGDPAVSRPMSSGLFQGTARAPGEAEPVGLPPRSAALAPAGLGDSEATVPQPVAVAGPAEAPGERVAAAAGVKVSTSGGRFSGGSAEAAVGNGSESAAAPGVSRGAAEADPASVLDRPLLPEPAPAGRAADPVASPRHPGIPAPQPPAVQVAATLLQRGGVPIERLRIALEPAELGSVELTLTSEGRRKARAILLVERLETLELLQRDQRTLERILIASGLELEAGGLEFGLRRDGEGRPEKFASPGRTRSSESVRSEPPMTPPRLLDFRLLDLVV